MKISENNEELDVIEVWKQEHGKIFKSIIGDDEYIWRRLKRQEYSQVMAMKVGETPDDRIYNRQVAIAKLAVLNMEEEALLQKMEELAGLAITISDEILNGSGFNLIATVEL